MAKNTRPIQFRDYLPEVFRADEVNGVSFLSRLLKAFETLFEELEAAIEGSILQLTVQATSGTTVTVAPFSNGPVAFPIGTPVTVLSKTLRTVLNQLIPANGTDLDQIEVQDAAFVDDLETGDVLNVQPVHPGGIPDLFNPDAAPPRQFTHRPESQADFDHLDYLASWIGLPLRPEKSAEWNRQFLKTAISLYPKRSTLPGMDGLLRAWLKGDLLETDPPLLILTDLTRTHNDVNTIFQLAPEEDEDTKPGEIYAQLGVNTVLGEGPPFFFIADLVTDPTVQELHNPVGLDTFQRAARFLLDSEKPAYTYYQLRVRAHTMIDEQVLFSIGRGYRTWLNHSRISTGLRKEFRSNSISLSQNATVSVEQPSSHWLITDGNTEYMIIRAKDKLNIHKGKSLPEAQMGEMTLADEPWVFDSDCYSHVQLNPHISGTHF